MILFKLSSPISLSSVNIHPVSELVNKISDDTQKQIDNLWKIELDKARCEGKILFDSSVWSFHDALQKDDKLILQLGKVPYSVRHIAKENPQIATKIGKQKATFTHIFLKLNDGNYVFLQRSNHFATDLKVSFVGGSFTAGQSLIDHVSEEMQEEVGLEYEQLEKTKILGIYENEFGNCGIVIYAELSMDKENLNEHFNTWVRSIDKPEATGLMFVHKLKMKDLFDKEMVRYVDALNLINDLSARDTPSYYGCW